MQEFTALMPLTLGGSVGIYGYDLLLDSIENSQASEKLEIRTKGMVTAKRAILINAEVHCGLQQLVQNILRV
jgi:hypothetical protein